MSLCIYSLSFPHLENRLAGEIISSSACGLRWKGGKAEKYSPSSPFRECGESGKEERDAQRPFARRFAVGGSGGIDQME